MKSWNWSYSFIQFTYLLLYAKKLRCEIMTSQLLQSARPGRGSSKLAPGRLLACTKRATAEDFFFKIWTPSSGDCYPKKEHAKQGVPFCDQIDSVHISAQYTIAVGLSISNKLKLEETDVETNKLLFLIFLKILFIIQNCC